MQQQTAEISLISWRKPFFVAFAINAAVKRPGFLAKTFVFWSAGMVAARWNLVRTEYGPQVKKVADLCTRFSNPSNSLNFYIPKYPSARLQSCIRYQGVKFWNEIASDIKKKSFHFLKRNYKEYLLNQY